jgi:hypothetical protein
LFLNEVVLDQSLTKFAVHERVGGDHTDVAGRLRIMAIDRQLEKSFDERHHKRVLAMTGRKAVPVFLIEGAIFDRNVRRITHYGVVLLDIGLRYYTSIS